MFEWKAACLSCILLSVAAALPLHYGSLPVQPGADPWPVPLLLGLGMLAAAVSIIAGCVCCHRLGKGAPAAIQGFNNATYDPTPGGELTLFPPISAVSGPAPPGARPQFEPLPELTAVAAHPVAHPRPAIYNLSVSRGFSAKDWFDDPHRNFPRQQLKYQQELGTGWFGQSLLGEARNLTAEPKTAVVVKALRAGATLPEQMYFLHEMSYLRDANHANVLRLLGRCVEADPYLLILERCGVGDAKEFLQRRSPAERQQLLETMTLNKMAMDAAAGLQHLHDIHYTHSDLAARNCRVMTNCTLKIGDYGCNIDKYKEDYYVAGDVALPVRWCAPEILECTPSTIETKEITKASNVWSLGVLMWELLAFAALPYAPLSDDDVIQHVVMDRNVQLSRPKLSTGSPHTDRMYHVMQLCWLPPSQRPTVHRIHALLAQLTVPPPDDFEERWEALRPRGRADGGSDSDSPEPAVSQPPSLDSELHDALRSLDRMLAAEETPADPTSGAPVSVPTTGGGDGTAVAEGDVDGESVGGGEESADEPGELTLAMRDQSRSVQDFLTLTAPLDSLEYSSERTESDPEQESALLTGEGREKAQDASVEDRGVSIAPAPARPPVVGATHAGPGSDASGTEAAATVPSPPPSEHAVTSPPRAPLSAAPVASLSSLPQASAPVVGGGGGDTGDGGGVGEASDSRTTGEASDARTTVEDPGGGGGTGISAGSGTPHAVPMVFCTEATPPRQPPTGEDGLQGLQAEEPAVSEPRAFRFVFGEKSSESGVAPESREESLERSVDGGVNASADASAGASTPAASEYFTAADSTLACADLSGFDDLPDRSAAGDSSEVPPLSKRLTSTPRGRRSPSFNDYIGSAYQTAVESPSDLSTDTVMGSRHSAPGYAPVAGDDVSAGSEAEACDAALLAGESRDDDVAMSELRRELRRDVERRGGAGDVPHSATVREKSLPASAAESPLPMSPIPADLSETAEHGSPPRSPSLSSTFGHSTCDELAELPDEEEVRSLCSRAELAPSKLWGSAEDPSTADRRCSADAITVIEAAPSRAGLGRESRAAVSVSGSLDVPGSLDVSPVLLEDLLGVDGHSQSSADVTPVMEEGRVLGKMSEEKHGEDSEEDYMSSKMEEGTSAVPDKAKSEDAHGEKSSVLEENLVTPVDVMANAEDALVKFENMEAVDKVSAADASVAESSPQAEQTPNVLVSASESVAPEKSIADNVASLVDSAPESTAKDSTLPTDDTPTDLEPAKSENDLLIDFSTPRSEASVDVLRASTGVISSASERLTLPCEHTPPSPPESSPSALLTIGDDVLSSIAESPQIAGAEALLFGEKRDHRETVPEPAVDSATLASVTESQQDHSTSLVNTSPMKNEAISLADSSPKVLSQAVPVPGRYDAADEWLVCLDGSGGFELTPGELTMPAATADGAGTATANFVPDDAETGADEAVGETVRDAVGDEVVGAVDGRVAGSAVEVAVADVAPPEVTFADSQTTAVSSATGQDSSQKYRIGSEPEQLGANYLVGSEPELMAVDTKAEASDENRLPPTSSCVSDRSARYQVSPDSTTAATTAASSETLLDEPQNRNDHQHHHQQQQRHQQEDEEEEMDEDNSFWDGLRRAAEQTQALMAEARRDSPQKTYRSMFLDGDASETSAGQREGEKDAEVAGATAVDGAMTSWSTADADVANATNTAHDAGNDVDGDADGDERRSGHTRHGSGGFDTLMPSGGDPASAFERLALETELDHEVEIDLGAGDEEAAFAAIRAELRRALPVADSRGEDPESSAAEAAADAAEAEAVAVELEEAGILCPPAVPGLETISEEGEEEEEDGAEEHDEAQDQIPDSWRDDFDAFVEVEIKPVGGVSGPAPGQQQPAASLAPAAEKQVTKSAPSVTLDDVPRTDAPAAGLGVKSQDGAQTEQKPAESNGPGDVEEKFFDLTKRVEPQDVEARLVTEIQLTNADRFKPSTGVFGDVEGVTKWSSDVRSTDDVMSDRGEPDGSHDVEPPAGGSAEFGQNLTKSVGVSESQQTEISSNGLGNAGSVENGLSKITHEDNLGEKQSLLVTMNGDTLAGDIGDVGDGLGDAGVGEVKAVTDEVGEAVGDTGDDLVKAQTQENGSSEDYHQESVAKLEVSKENETSTAKPAESESNQDADILKAPKIEFKIGEPASLSSRLRAASVEGAILIPGVGDVYSSLTSESLTFDAAKADVLSKPAADFTSKPADVTSRLMTDVTSSKPTDVTFNSSAAADVAASECSVAPSRRAVSADLVAELKALASAAESRPPATTAGAGAGRGKTDRDAKQRSTAAAAAAGPDLMLQDLESSPSSAPAARDALRARIESPSCDSDASDVLEVDTESLEARLVEGGRPRSHVAFVLRADQPLTNDNTHDGPHDAALDDAHAHPSPPEEDGERLQTRFDLSRSGAEVREDQSRTVSGGAWHEGEDSDYEGDYESLPVDVNGSGGATAAGAGTGLTRSVASYNLSASAATPGWQGADADAAAAAVPDWQYPAPDSELGAGGGAGAGGGGVDAGPGVEVELEAESESVGQPASLPATVGCGGNEMYHVLSQGEMYHRTERRSSLPLAGRLPTGAPPLSASALTAEELDIDASIPTYDDVRQFGDPDDSLSSSDDEEDGMGRGVSGGRGRESEAAPWLLNFASTQTLGDEEAAETAEDSVDGVDAVDVVDDSGVDREEKDVKSGRKEGVGVNDEEKKVTSDIGDKPLSGCGAKLSELITSAKDKPIGDAQKGDSEVERGDSRGEGEIGLDESGAVLERPHRPVPGEKPPVADNADGLTEPTEPSELTSTTTRVETETQAAAESSKAQSTTEASKAQAAAAGTTDKPATEMKTNMDEETESTDADDGVIFDRVTRPERPPPGARPPKKELQVYWPDDTGSRPVSVFADDDDAAFEDADANDDDGDDSGGACAGPSVPPARSAAAAPAAPEESRWSPEAPAAGGEAEAAFLDDDVSPWSASDAIALRERLQLINEQFSDGPDAEDERSAERAERLRRLNEQWGVPQPGEEQGRYTPDWEADDDDDEDDDGLSSTSGEFVWQEGGDRAAEAAGGDSAPASDSGSDSESESGEEEFTPSVWRQDREPGHGLLRSPERKSDLRKSVSFKRQKHHRIYEYPGAPASPDLGEQSAAQSQRKTWSFVAPASVSHYTDWELDDEEIEDISLTELPESPDRQPPRLAPAAASHYFLSAGGDAGDTSGDAAGGGGDGGVEVSGDSGAGGVDVAGVGVEVGDGDDDDEFYIQPGFTAGAFTGGSSFTPADVFPADEAAWAGAAQEEHAWRPPPAEGRFIDVWSRGGAGVAEEVVSPDVLERPIVSGDGNADGGAGEGVEMVTTLDSCDTPAWSNPGATTPIAATADGIVDPASRVGLTLTEDTVILSESAPQPGVAEAKDAPVTAAAAVEKQMEEWERAARGVTIRPPGAAEPVESDSPAKEMPAATTQPASSDEHATADVERSDPDGKPAVTDVVANVYATSAGPTATELVATSAVVDTEAIAMGDGGSIGGLDVSSSLNETSVATAADALAFTAGVADTASATSLATATAAATTAAIATGAALDTSSPNPDTLTPGTTETESQSARPARDKLFLDLTGAPADTVDSGYTGSCDDRTVAAFVALGRSE